MTDVNIKDSRYRSSPLGGAIEGRCNGRPAITEITGRLADFWSLQERRSKVDPDWLRDEQIRADPRMLSILQGEKT